MKHVLFICSQNKLRSPTAEQIFSDYPGVETASAGISNDAEIPLTPELIEWADLIFVMEKIHREKLSAKFKPYLGKAHIICLNIPDKYNYMDPTLVKILRKKITPFLQTI
jgi:predicted protein tyrosine phosphatase